MNIELTDDQICDIGEEIGSPYSSITFARAVIAADRALQDARHTEALKKEREAHAETNRMMTEALMQAEAPCAGCGETCKRAKLCATCAGEIAATPNAPQQEAAQGVPDEWVLVPVQPSIAACINGSDAVGCVVDGYQCADVYRAMLAAAAPQPSAQPERGEIVVTKNEAGQIVAVTRQDEDGQILEVIATSKETEWRKLALQYDAHRMKAIWYLKAVLDDPEYRNAAIEFLNAPPPDGQSILEEIQSELKQLRSKILELRYPL